MIISRTHSKTRANALKRSPKQDLTSKIIIPGCFQSFLLDTPFRRFIYLATQNASKKWSMPIRDWKPALNRFMIEFEDRLTDYIFKFGSYTELNTSSP